LQRDSLNTGSGRASVLFATAAACPAELHRRHDDTNTTNTACNSSCSIVPEVVTQTAKLLVWPWRLLLWLPHVELPSQLYPPALQPTLS
jgi:hypothetical protein